MRVVGNAVKVVLSVILCSSIYLNSHIFDDIYPSIRVFIHTDRQMYICIYVYIYIYVCTYVHMYTHIHIYIHTYIHAYTYVCIFIIYALM